MASWIFLSTVWYIIRNMSFWILLHLALYICGSAIKQSLTKIIQNRLQSEIEIMKTEHGPKESRRGDCPPPQDDGVDESVLPTLELSVDPQFSTWHSVSFLPTAPTELQLYPKLNTQNRKWLPKAKATSVCDDRQTLCPMAQGHGYQRHLGQLLPAILEPHHDAGPEDHRLSQWIWSMIADTWLSYSRELAAVRFGMWNILSEGYAGLGWK